ncbi:MAG: glucose PTS transporter subunit IIA, partial [Bdellovibrionales bacterium]
HKSRRTVIAGVMLSAALTSILTGITEPIEFSFIFVAPLLFVVHVALAFCSGLLTHFFEIQLGYTFSASLIDFVTGFFNQKNALSLWLIVGPLMALAYFFSFYTLIGWLKLVTPGRESQTDVENPAPASTVKVSAHNKEHIEKIASALGGPENWLQVEACITRLRMKVKDSSLINEAQLRHLGAVGIMKAGQNVQVVFGTQSDSIREALLKVEKKPILFSAPMSGKIHPLSEVPDATFSQKILGDGFAINPSNNEVRSPFAGQVSSLIPTFHAIGLTNDQGFETLIHVGIDTVKMKGQGFQAHVKEGDTVKQGQLLLSFDPQLIKEMGYPLITPIIFTAAEGWKWKLTSKTEIQSGEAALDELKTQ